MVRRGRVKVAYSGEVTQLAVQIDVTEKGVATKDAYIAFTEPFLKTFGIKAGIFDRPFGYEISYSSSLRESPERGRMSQILFPGERDLGAMLIIQPPKTSKWNFFRIEGGMFAGDGINPDFKQMKDFIGHLTFFGTSKNEFFKWGAGVSYYNGGVYQGTKYIYKMATLDDGETKGFAIDSASTNLGAYANRGYYGVDAQLTFAFPWGITTLRGEYIMGQQPAYDGNGSASTNDPTYYKTAPAKNTYIRNFNGAYFYFIQDIWKSPVQIAIKYDWYNPNTEVSGDNIKPTYSFNNASFKTYLSSSDIPYATLGLGVNYRFLENLKLCAWYAIVRNQGTMISGYYTDVKDNVFTLRLQYKF